MALMGSITESDRNFIETWENITRSKYAIVKVDSRGDLKRQVVIGGASFMLTTEDRIITQDIIKRREDDPFSNGCFRPIVAPDSITIETNPNAISDDEIKDMLSLSDPEWTEAVERISSPHTLSRMMEFADSVNISILRYRDIEKRQKEARGDVRVSQKDRAQYEKL
jgi:hypothetical protein